MWLLLLWLYPNLKLDHIIPCYRNARAVEALSLEGRARPGQYNLCTFYVMNPTYYLAEPFVLPSMQARLAEEGET